MATATETKVKTRTKSASRPTAKAKPTSATKRAAKTPPAARRDNREFVDRSVDMTDDVLEKLKNGGKDAIGAVRSFVSSVDEALHGHEDSHSRGHAVVDSALEMSDRVVESGSDAIRGIVKSAGRNFGTTSKN